ncbi:TIGR02710 family CRISPR-associated CARF protein [Thermus islandicus]|uniref:TIGR02710 family CRISPR-associated CARF protein n=1 Tax=Thermus islandicus TaxID=540988 RepID=UPI0003B45280|nr:TIGR02710 family CRISPR-associated CARF protein [Thermus islandicus]
MAENPLDRAGGDLEALWLQYKEAVRAGGNPHDLYQKMVWPTLLEKWRKEPSVYPSPQPFAVSIHTLGTSPEATALAILGGGAEQVYVLHTAESARFLPRLREDTGKDLYPLEIGKSDVAAIYREVKRLLERYPDVPVALDLTSGTKAMSAGLAAAGFFFQRFFPKVWVVYVDNEDYDPELRRPRAGTERLVILPNPHEALAEVDALFAKELYGRGEFGEAAGYFGRMVGKTGDQRYLLYKMLAEMYHAWRTLDAQGAVRQGRALLGRLSENAWLQHPLNERRKALEAQVGLLEVVQSFLASQDFGEKKGVYGLAWTLLRLSQAMADAQPVLAALYAYRALELLLQERLALLGRRAEAPGLSLEEEAATREELARILRLSPGEARVGAKLGLLEILAFLRAHGDSVVGGLPLAELQGLSGVLKARNEALLVHGFRVPTQNEVGQLQRLAQRLLEDLEARSGVRGVPWDPVPLGF